MRAPYVAKSLIGAQAEVRRLRKQNKEYFDEIESMEAKLRLLARLASDEPEFSNPLHVYEAKKIRNEYLKRRIAERR